MGGAVALQGVRGSAADCIRRAVRFGGAALHASVAGAKRRGNARADGCGLLALWTGTKRAHAGNFSALLARTSAGEAPVEASGTFCSRIARVVQGLTRRGLFYKRAEGDCPGIRRKRDFAAVVDADSRRH